MAKVFISYSRADLETVKELVQDLEELDQQPWFDQVLTGGQRWWDTILDNIRRSEFVICTLTPESLNSQACKLEAGYAIKLGKPILPLRLSAEVSSNSLPPLLSELQIVDYRRQDKDALKALSKAVKTLPKAPPLAESLPDPPAVPVSYLSTLREKIDASGALDFKEQLALVFQLRDHFREGGPADEIAGNLRRLSHRDDFLAKVSPELTRVVEEIASSRPVATPPGESAEPRSVLESARQAEAPGPGSDPAPPRAKKPAAPVETSRKKAAPQGDVVEGEKHLLLHLSESAGELAGLMQKSLDDGAAWILEIDSINNYTIAPSPAEEPAGLTVTANLRDGVTGSRKRELKALGWEIDNSNVLKSAIGGAALYATAGIAAIALLSKNVRDEFMNFQGTRSWPVGKGKNPGKVCAKAASEVAIALEKTAPGVDVIIVKRQEREDPSAAATQ